MATAMKIGELAKLTGLTVRTLHHYDDIGLLNPSHRTEAGHRLYGSQDIRRLQMIISLQCLHLSLKDIKETLMHDAMMFDQVLARHIANLENEITQKHVLLERLKMLQSRIQAKEDIPLEEYVKNIEVIVMYEKYYTQEQLNILKEREAKLTDAEKGEIHQKWMALFAEFKEACQQKKDLTDPSVLKLGQQANEYVRGFTGGDPAMEASHQKMYSTEGGSNVLKQHGVDLSQEVFEYMAKAMGAAKAQTEQ